jgi:hypothetical protein
MLLVFALVSLAAWMVLERNNELFLLDWRAGQARLVRGNAPARLRRELARVLQAAGVAEVRVRVTSRTYGARLEAEGVDAEVLTELRRVLQTTPLAQLQATETSFKNRVLRFVGVSSLVWLLGNADE